jgi:hypothetical protein
MNLFFMVLNLFSNVEVILTVHTFKNLRVVNKFGIGNSF